MKTLDLEKIWQVLNILSKKQQELSEQDIYINLIGHRSEYGEMSFESFISYYCFRFEDNNIIIFNQDGIPWETYSNNDFSYIPISLLDFSEEELENWMKGEIESQLKQQELKKLQKKEDIKAQIERLQKQLL